MRKVLTSYQSSLEEEQNQQLLVRLVLSFFQAQTLERQAQHNMESLLEEDNLPAKSGASKRKLKKDRRLKRQELADEQQTSWGVTWDEDHVRGAASRCVASSCVASPRRPCRHCAHRSSPLPCALSHRLQELLLLTQMGWNKCMGSSAPRPSGRRHQTPARPLQPAPALPHPALGVRAV